MLAAHSDSLPMVEIGSSNRTVAPSEPHNPKEPELDDDWNDFYCWIGALLMELSREDANRLRAFIECYVETPLLRSIQQDFDRLRFNKQFAGEPQCMLLTGDAGTGKSSLLRHYMAKSPGQVGHGFIRKPLLISRIPSKPTLESTMVELLKDLGQWGSEYRRNKSSAESLTEALIKCLGRCETELIIIDEFQELIENKTREKRNQIANRLKYISETAKIPIALVGMPWAVKIAEEPQWASRLLIRRSLPYFKLSEDPENFVRFVMGPGQADAICQRA